MIFLDFRRRRDEGKEGNAKYTRYPPLADHVPKTRAMFIPALFWASFVTLRGTDGMPDVRIRLTNATGVPLALDDISLQADFAAD